MKYLITGAPGTGKSTLAQAFKDRGLPAIDIEADTDIAYSKNKTTGQKEIVPVPRPIGWRLNHTWVWDSDKLNDFLAAHANDKLFIFGLSDNQQAYLSLFDKLFVLKIDNHVLEHRLQTRTNSEFGKQQHELDETLERNALIIDSILSAGGTAIDNDRPAESVVDEILELANG